MGFAAIRLLEQAGCQVEVPRAQTCCGQPAYNSGDRATTRDLARGILDAFGGYDYVVVPSGSCGGMLRVHMPHLFDDDPNLRARADALAAKTYELVSFLTDVLGVERVPATYRGTSPITMPARACASSASRTSRAACCARWRASSCTRWRSRKCAAASAARSA